MPESLNLILQMNKDMLELIGKQQGATMALMDSLTASSLETVCHQYGISLVVLFGSQVTGLARDDSDVDLGVLVDCYPLALETELALIRDLVHATRSGNLDVTILNQADPLLGYHVVRHGIPVYEREPHTLSRYRLRAWKRFIDTARFRRLQRPFVEAFLKGAAHRARQNRYPTEAGRAV